MGLASDEMSQMCRYGSFLLFRDDRFVTQACALEQLAPIAILEECCVRDFVPSRMLCGRQSTSLLQSIEAVLGVDPGQTQERISRRA